MRVAALAVDGMYDEFDFELDLNLNERVTILHGANGLGKTTLLNLVENVLRGAWGAVARAPVRRFEVRLDDGRRLVVRNRAPAELTAAGTATHGDMSVELAQADGAASQLWRPTHLPEAGAATWRRVTEANPYLTQTGPEEWLDRRTGHSMTTNALLARHPEAVPILRRLVEEPDWLAEIIDGIPCRLIGADRLIVWEPQTRFEDVSYSGWMPAVTWYSNLIVRSVRDAQRRYADTAGTLDRSFPSRVLSETSQPPADAELRDRFARQGERLMRLHAFSLIDEPAPITLPERTLDDAERRVLWTYLLDSDSKLAAFDDVLERLEALFDILQARAGRTFLHKRLVMDREQGLVVRLETGQSVPLSSLSSGEQHLLVLVCALLFEVASGSLVLIDEPELSLHIAWQQAVVDGLIRTGAVRALDFLIATHSPQIVHNHWDLTVDLEGEDEGYDPDDPDEPEEPAGTDDPTETDELGKGQGA